MLIHNPREKERERAKGGSKGSPKQGFNFTKSFMVFRFCSSEKIIGF
jgi:hypothetical protein